MLGVAVSVLGGGWVMFSKAEERIYQNQVRADAAISDLRVELARLAARQENLSKSSAPANIK